MASPMKQCLTCAFLLFSFIVPCQMFKYDIKDTDARTQEPLRRVKGERDKESEGERESWRERGTTKELNQIEEKQTNQEETTEELQKGFSARVRAALAVIGWALLILLLIGAFTRALQPSDDRQASQPLYEESSAVCAMQVLYCMLSVFDCMAFTYVIPESYDLAFTLGGAATTSGVLIGIYSSFVAPAAVCTKLLMDDETKSRALTAGSVLVAGVATLLVALCADLGSTSWYYRDSVPHLRLALLFASRAAVGASTIGIARVAFKTFVQRRTPAAAMTVFQVQSNNGNVLGFVLGPLLCSTAAAVTGSTAPGPNVATASYLMVPMWLTLFVAVLCVIPPVSAVDSKSSCAPSSTSNEGSATIWWCNIAYDVLRAFMVGSLEAATSMVLETEFEMKPKAIGVIISCAFFLGLPLSMLLLRLKEQLQIAESKLSQGLALSCVLSSFLLLPGLGVHVFGSHHSEIACILLSDSMMLPAATVGKGIMDSLGANFAAQEGFYSQANLITAQIILAQSIGRFGGPTVTRWVLHSSGRSAFMCLQLATSVLSLMTVFKATTAAAEKGRGSF